MCTHTTDHRGILRAFNQQNTRLSGLSISCLLWKSMLSLERVNQNCDKEVKVDVDIPLLGTNVTYYCFLSLDLPNFYII